MGKASKWLRSLFGFKSSSPSSSQPSSPAKDNKNTGYDNKPADPINSNRGSVAGDDRPLGDGGPRWSDEGEGSSSSCYVVELDANKHAIAVAAATAAVAEAALAAAQAAAEVVRLTSAGPSVSCARTASPTPPCSGGANGRELAAIKIQSAFRAYLARRALRALKALVKLQALARGRIVRKHSADMLRRMQAMARIQARACASRAYSSDSSQSLLKSRQHHHAAVPAHRKPDNPQHYRQEGTDLKRRMSKPNISNSIKVEGLHLGPSWLDRWMEECSWNNYKDNSANNVSREDEKNVKILEIDTWKPHYNPRQSDKTFQGSPVFRVWNENGQGVATFDPLPGLAAKLEKPNPSVSSGEVPALRSLKFPPQEDQALPWTAENSPCLHSASSRPGSSSRRGPFTPSRSECSHSVLGEYLSHPSYMANTESSLAKLRSQSAPRQRIQYERLGTNRKFIPSLWEVETISEKGSTPPTNLRNKEFRSSGLKRVGHTSQGDSVNFTAASNSRR